MFHRCFLASNNSGSTLAPPSRIGDESLNPMQAGVQRGGFRVNSCVSAVRPANRDSFLERNDAERRITRCVPSYRPVLMHTLAINFRNLATQQGASAAPAGERAVATDPSEIAPATA
jgi:hypothetical protein